jgi:hypothetical protein
MSRFVATAALAVACFGTGLTDVGAGRVLRWTLATVFGLGALWDIAILVPNGTSLRLTPEGFWIRIVFRSIPLIRWDEVERFHAEGSHVVFDYVGGRRGILPDSLGMRAKALAGLLDEWRERHARPAGGSAR